MGFIGSTCTALPSRCGGGDHGAEGGEDDADDGAGQHDAAIQGRTLIHFSAHRKHLLRYVRRSGWGIKTPLRIDLFRYSV